MAWIIRTPNGEVSSDDFTLSDLGEVEAETGEPWSTLNVFRSIKVAKAFMRIAYRHVGLDPDEVDGLTLGAWKHSFDFTEDKPFPGGDDADPLGSPNQSSSESSPGAPVASVGGRAKRAKSA